MLIPISSKSALVGCVFVVRSQCRSNNTNRKNASGWCSSNDILNRHCLQASTYYWQYEWHLFKLSDLLVPNNFTAILDGRFPDHLPALKEHPAVEVNSSVPHELSSPQATSVNAPPTLVKRYLTVTRNKRGGRWTIWCMISQPSVILVEYVGSCLQTPSSTPLLPLPLPPQSFIEATLRALKDRNLHGVQQMLNTHPTLVGQRVTKYGWNWLHASARFGYYEAPDYLSSTYSFMVHKRLSNQSTPLHQAAYHGDCRVILLLCERGACLTTTITTPFTTHAFKVTEMQFTFCYIR